MAKATNADVKNNELSAEEVAQQYTGALVDKALEAERVYATYSQEQVDKIVAAMALAGSEASLELAKKHMPKLVVVSLRIKILKTTSQQNTFMNVSK